jgi:hypothetical protein
LAQTPQVRAAGPRSRVAGDDFGLALTTHHHRSQVIGCVRLHLACTGELASAQAVKSSQNQTSRNLWVMMSTLRLPASLFAESDRALPSLPGDQRLLSRIKFAVEIELFEYFPFCFWRPVARRRIEIHLNGAVFMIRPIVPARPST